VRECALCGRPSLFGVVDFKIVHVANSSLDLRLDRHLQGACALLIFRAPARPIESMQRWPLALKSFSRSHSRRGKRALTSLSRMCDIISCTPAPHCALASLCAVKFSFLTILTLDFADAWIAALPVTCPQQACRSARHMQRHAKTAGSSRLGWSDGRIACVVAQG
jgi:hypothetical protein